jgi:hypothetical protein
MLAVDRTLVSGVRDAAGRADLHRFVQLAIELEHSTVPPYLTAYYTLRPGTNAEIAAAVRGVAVEEMLHLTVAANLLLALGGRPRIAAPDFVPDYPTVLPMNVGHSVVVGLAPYSPDLVRDVFMRIEEPERPLQLPGGSADRAADPEFATIGEFYAALRDKLTELGDSAFVGDPRRQVVDRDWFPPDQLFPIRDVASAVTALELVAEEGEGTSSSPLDREGEPAHYYRFAELVHGRRLVADPSVPQGFSYTGAPVPFDPDGVWPMPPDPRLEAHRPGSRSRFVAERFTDCYTRLLQALQLAFDGAPGGLRPALGLMFELRLLAQDALATPDADGRPTGLCFRYSPALGTTTEHRTPVVSRPAGTPAER